MTITVNSTTEVVDANGVKCRVWEGRTANGIAIQCLIAKIAVHNGQDVSEFEAELEETHAPRDASLRAFPLRMRMLL